MSSILIFAVILGVGVDAFIGILGSRRNIGFGWAFIISLCFTPIVGLIAVLLSQRLAAGTEPKYGCLGFTFGLFGVVVMILIIMAILLTAGAILLPFA